MGEDRKVAVVLMNLGGPDGPDAVEPFLFNLFFDPQIIRVPTPLRWLIAKLVSKRRAPIAREIYANMGGKSPIVPETEAQAKALEASLKTDGVNPRVFMAMRYWHPMSEAVARDVKAWGPDEVVLLPLYPQFSTTTTQSSLMEWRAAARKAGLSTQKREICCYPTLPAFLDAHAELIGKSISDAGVELGSARVLFSAHGLPKKIVDSGDPYPIQVEATVDGVVEKLGWGKDVDWRVTYQSRVGPLEWIGPDTEEEIKQAASEGKTIVVVPIAFVSEHSETLVELDIEYRELADEGGAAGYVRVPALGANRHYIDALRETVVHALKGEMAGNWTCPKGKVCLRSLGT